MENSTYHIGELYIGGKSLEIDRDQFLELERAKELVTNIHRVESLYEVLLESVIEFEKLILDETFSDFWGGRSELKSDTEVHIKFDRLNIKLNVRLLSVLSASRAYHDQRTTVLKLVSLDESLSSKADEIFSGFFASSLNYRIVEALRNYTQHRALPIDALSFGLRNRYPEGYGDNKKSVYRATIAPHITKRPLIDDLRFKRSVAKELEAIEQSKLDARALIRSYFSMISEGHDEISELLQGYQTEAEESVHKSRSKCETALQVQNLRHFSAWEKVNGKVEKELYLDSSVFEATKYFQKSTGGMKSVRRGYVSSELVADKDAFIGEFDDVWIE